MTAGAPRTIRKSTLHSFALIADQDDWERQAQLRLLLHHEVGFTHAQTERVSPTDF